MLAQERRTGRRESVGHGCKLRSRCDQTGRASSSVGSAGSSSVGSHLARLLGIARRRPSAAAASVALRGGRRADGHRDEHPTLDGRVGHQGVGLGLEVGDLRLELETEHLAPDFGVRRGQRGGIGRSSVSSSGTRR